MRLPSLLGFLVLSACGPQNAKLEAGDFAAFIAATNSVTAQKGNIDYNEFESYHTVDCREFATANTTAENNRLRLDDFLKICDGGGLGGGGSWPPTHETWLAADGFHVVGDPLDAWRGEAVLTSEGDLQLGFHSRLPGNEDLRFQVVVDPNFQPRRCEEDENGEPQFVEIDDDWVANWSDDLRENNMDPGLLFYLNGSAYQFAPQQVALAAANPSGSVAQPWYLPEEWRAGFAAANFGDDRFRVRGPRYADPAQYTAFEAQGSLFGGATALSMSDIYYCGTYIDPNYSSTGFPQFFNNCSGQANEANAHADTIVTEYTLVKNPLRQRVDGLPNIRPMIHTNEWREDDGRAAGLDGWVELHYSWIRFDEGADFSVGGAVSGEFNILFDAEDSASRLYIRGRFDVPRIKRDTWTTEFLPDAKGEEYGSEVCGVPSTELQ